MKSGITLFLAVLVTSVLSIPLRRDVNPALVPDLGWKAGINPTGTGDCDGAVNGTDGKPKKIPCQCPPDRITFLANLNANVAAGRAVNNTAVKVDFPEGNSNSDVDARFTAMAVTLQNSHGIGQGCPMVSTTLAAQKAAIDAARSTAGSAPSTPAGSRTAPTPAAPGGSTSAPAASKSPGGNSSTSSTSVPSASSSASSSAPSALPSSINPALVPDLGWKAGINPTGTGDCDGAVNGTDGKPKKIPCQCPPDRITFLANLNANVAAGRAVNNTAVKVDFPEGNSNSDVDARFTAMAVTLQNSHGIGQGCPMVSTTLAAQKAAIDAARSTAGGASPSTPAASDSTSSPGSGSSSTSAPPNSTSSPGSGLSPTSAAPDLTSSPGSGLSLSSAAPNSTLSPGFGLSPPSASGSSFHSSAFSLPSPSGCTCSSPTPAASGPSSSDSTSSPGAPKPFSGNILAASSSSSAPPCNTTP